MNYSLGRACVYKQPPLTRGVTTARSHPFLKPNFCIFWKQQQRRTEGCDSPGATF